MVVFASSADNLVPGITNASGQWNIFVRDRQSGTTELVSVAANGEPANRDTYAPAISADGRFVAFASDAGNLVPEDDNGHTDVFIAERG